MLCKAVYCVKRVGLFVMLSYVQCVKRVSIGVAKANTQCVERVEFFFSVAERFVNVQVYFSVGYAQISLRAATLK